jgi:hypothetical protein
MGKLKDQLITEQEEADNSRKSVTMYDIATTKAHTYAQEYNSISGRIEEKHGYRHLKEGYVAGFLDGFAYKLTGDEQ